MVGWLGGLVLLSRVEHVERVEFGVGWFGVLEVWRVGSLEVWKCVHVKRVGRVEND